MINGKIVYIYPEEDHVVLGIRGIDECKHLTHIKSIEKLGFWKDIKHGNQIWWQADQVFISMTINPGSSKKVETSFLCYSRKVGDTKEAIRKRFNNFVRISY